MATAIIAPFNAPVQIQTGTGITTPTPAQILALQAPANGPLSPLVYTVTNGLNIPPRAIDRLRNFPEEVYSLNSTDNLVRLMMVLLGQAGVGQWRSRALQARLQATLSGANFYQLDAFYGALFNVNRMSGEVLVLNPYTELGTFDQWSQVAQQDSSYRTRIEQFGKAVSLGPSAIGIQLVAEAILQCPCEIVESWETADQHHNTWGDLETFGTWGDLETHDGPGTTWGQLEIGDTLLDINRKYFTVVPYRPISQEESYSLMQVLNILKPADSIANIDTRGYNAVTPITVRGVAADSSYWQMIESVIPNPQYADIYNLDSTPDEFGFYQVLHPPFSEYQGEEIVYNPDISGIVGYTLVITGYGPPYTEVVVPFGSPPLPPQGTPIYAVDAVTNVGAVNFLDGTVLYYPPTQAAATRFFNAAGRLVSDGILQSAPYSADPQNVSAALVVANTGSVAPGNTSNPVQALPQTLYVDGIAVPALVDTIKDSTTTQSWKLQVATGNQNYWASPQRAISDQTVEAIELRLVAPRLINSVSVNCAHFPQNIQVQVWDSVTSAWNTVYSKNIYDSVPNYLPATPPVVHEDPQHSAPGAWEQLDISIDPVSTSKVRFLMKRLSNGNGPVINTLSLSTSAPFISTPVPYSLALQDVTLGYNIYEQADLPTAPIFTSDFLESQVEWSVRQEVPNNVLDEIPIPWRSSPQVAADAVVNFYLDTRDYTGLGQLIDRFFVDPLYTNVHCTLYYCDEDTSLLPFDAEATPLVPPASTNVGSVVGSATGLGYSPTDVQYTQIENVAVQFNPNAAWWWGMVFSPGYSSVEAAGQCLWDTGRGLNLTVEPGPGTQAAITVETADGQFASTNLNFQANDIVYATVVYLPEGSSELAAGIYVFASVNMAQGQEIVSRYALGLMQAQVHPIFDSFNSSVNLFGYYVPTEVVSGTPTDLYIGALQSSPVPANMEMLSMVIKQIVPTVEQINTYSQEYASYTVVSPYIGTDPTRNTSNSIVRFNPVNITPENPTGMLGGPGYFYPELPWTPVVRDYIMQKGFMFFNPTKAKFWKFEFTNLSAQPLNSFVAVNQPYQTHNGIVPGLVQQQPTPPVQDPGNQPAGAAFNQSSVTNQNLNFNDTIFSQLGSTTANNGYVAGGTLSPPTAVQVAADQNVQAYLANTAWYWQYQEWFQGNDAPRFLTTGVHNYNGDTISQSAQVGFFVGLNALSAYRLNAGSQDDTAVYDVLFADDTYLQAGSLTWSLNPYDLYTDESSSFPTVCESTSLLSTTPIIGVQFATSQSDAVEIANDDEFQSALLIDTDWTNTDIAHGVGDVFSTPHPYTVLSYLQDTYQVQVLRNFNAGTITLTPQQQGRLVRPDVHPIFDERDLTIPAPSGTDFGGLATSLCATGSEGNVWAAVRLTVDTPLDQPLFLELVDAGPGPDFDTPTVLASVAFDPAPGQIVEQVLGYELGSVIAPGNPIYAQVVQYGNVNDNRWTISRLSVFDEGIVWKFSLDGGGTFYNAFDIRNNANGMLTFPFAGTQLIWRAEGTRPGVHVNYLRIRPVYDTPTWLPPEATVRGANVALVDQWPPIQDDPLFNGWNNPVPFWWFLGYQYSLLGVSGVPTPGEGNSFYVRTATDNIAIGDDTADRTYYALREIEDFTSVTDSTVRDFTGERNPSDSTSVSDGAMAYRVYLDDGGLMQPEVWPHRGVLPDQ